MLQNQKGSTNWYVGYVSFFLGARTWFLGQVTKIDFQARRTPYTPVSRLLEDDVVDLEVILSDLAPASQSLHSVDADSGT